MGKFKFLQAAVARNALQRQGSLYMGLIYNPAGLLSRRALVVLT